MINDLLLAAVIAVLMRPLHSIPSHRTTLTDADYAAAMKLFGFYDISTFRAFAAEQQRKQDRRTR